LVIITIAPIAIPKAFGVQAFNVISGSMEPTISVGSIVYVKNVDFEELAEGDVIAFESGASVVTHRIVGLNPEDRLIATKGDANNAADFNPVAYVNVIGKMVAHFPIYGNIATWLTDTVGKLVAAVVLVVGAVLSYLSEDKKEKAINEKAVKINPKVILVTGLVIVFSSLAGFIYIFLGYEKSNQLYAELKNEKLQYEETTDWEDMLDVDFAGLTQINPDVAGWIYVEGTDISYPIMYSGDDYAYLRTDINKEYAKAGSIFLEGYNLPDFSDSHSIIYGHNMKNGSMFGQLKDYSASMDLYNKSKYFWIFTPDYDYRYEIISAYTTEINSVTYTLFKGPGQEFLDYENTIVTLSDIPTTPGNLSVNDKIVTLSTCTDNESTRYVVQGKRVDMIRRTGS
jgi:sortase B